MIHLPQDTLGYLTRLVRDRPEDVQPALRARYATDGPDSVTTLSPSQPVIQAARQLPVRTDVDVHSIIGIRSASNPDAGDGVVPLASAQWPVGTEYRIAGGHDLHLEPATILVLKQILLQRLQGAAPAVTP